ncbi:MAG TPA: hypothetical protein VE528_02550, partial [Thermoleophilaceae bacterium]|nr:hypothetical protein [Thermoleophilaceae bacterium]
YPEDLRELIDSYLDGLRFSDSPSTEGLEDAMRYSLLAGGKRVRPVLCLATARSTGADPATFLPAAAAIESAKELCGADAPAFVNGMLAAVHRAQEAPAG